MLTSLIRNLFTLLIALYTYFKLLNTSPKNKYVQLLFISYSAIISLCASIFFISNQALNWLFIFLSFLIIIKVTTNINMYIIYITFLFSFSLSFITFTLSGIIIAFILLPFLYENYSIPWAVIRLPGASIHAILIYLCFRIPRLKRGMQFIYHIPSGNIGSTICVVFLMFILMFAQSQTYAESYILICSALLLIVTFILFYWWNYHITQTYKKFLRKNEIDSLNLLLEERNQEINYLKSENDKLARIIHKDNKIIPALSMAIIDSHENKTELNLPKLETDSSLHMKLKQLYAEREKTLANYQQEIMHLPQTGFDSINAVLSYMQTESLKAGIPYQVVLFDDLTSTIPSKIKEDDFVHILSDLLSNALNACKNAPSSAIQIYLGKMDEISTIKVYNTGSVFDIETLKNLGLSRHTTHADTGGSGIGLMDIWMIKERYTATLLIDEVTDSLSSYTSINILFNHKNHYIIQSDRHKELSAHINRPDIMIMSKE